MNETENLKVGDLVVVHGSGWISTSKRIGKIIAETAKCWRVQTGRNLNGEEITQLYYKKNGMQRGDVVDSWCNAHIEADPDGSKCAAIKISLDRQRKVEKLKNCVIWEQLTIKELDAIGNILGITL